MTARKGKPKTATEKEAPAQLFAARAEAQAAADKITNAPRRGIAKACFEGASGSWFVEVRLRNNRHGNPGILRVDGTVRRYH